MATYTFKCKNCKYTVTQNFPIKDRPDTLTCPKCGEEMPRLITTPNVIFRGNGWGKDYKHD